MGGQVAPPFGHLRRELGDAVDDRHEVLRVAGERRAEYRAVGLLLQPDTQPANRPRPMREPRIPIVSTDRLTLRGFETADQPAYAALRADPDVVRRSEEHTSELQSLMRTSYAVFCLKKKQQKSLTHKPSTHHGQQL